MFFWPLTFVITPVALLALEDTKCLVGPPSVDLTLGSSKISDCIDLQVSGNPEKQSCRKLRNLHVKWSKSLGIS